MEETFVVNCHAVGSRFVSGIAKQYDSTFPSQLKGIIDEKDFENTMERINDAIIQFWPCTTCFVFGFACAPFTLGTSLCCPNFCVSKAEENLLSALDHVSMMPKYYEKKITWSLKKTCFNSWIQIEIPHACLSTSTDTPLHSVPDC